MSTFDEKAADWDTPERRERARRLAQAVRAEVPLDTRMRAIDIGAGTGLLGLELLGDVASMVLADPSEGMVEVARTKIKADRISGASAIVYDVPGEPPPGAPFDLVVSLLALHHVEDTEATLRTIHAMLAPGGRVALADLDAEDGTFHAADAEGIQHHGFERGALVQLAESVGFSDARTRIVLEVERNGRAYPLFLLTAQRGTSMRQPRVRQKRPSSTSGLSLCRAALSRAASLSGRGWPRRRVLPRRDQGLGARDAR